MFRISSILWYDNENVSDQKWSHKLKKAIKSFYHNDTCLNKFDNMMHFYNRFNSDYENQDNKTIDLLFF